MLLTTPEQDAVFAAFVADLNSNLGSTGIIKFWTGSVPASADDPDIGTLVATCALASTPLFTPSGVSTSFDTIAPDTSTVAGTVTYARVCDAGGTVYLQMTCGVGSEEIVFDSNVFANGDTLNVTGLSIASSFS